MNWQQQSGWIDTDLCLLGHADVPVYLLRLGAEEYALVEGGICADAELIWQDLLEQVDPSLVRYWLITHKHYDHCGAMAVLMPRLASARLLVAPQTWQAWQSETCRRLITRLNAELCPTGNRLSDFCMELHQLPHELIQPGESFVAASGRTLELLAAPGHSPDSVAWYDRAQARLFAADAVGEYDPVESYWRPLIFDQAQAYLATLGHWKSLPVKQLIPGHGGCLTTSDTHRIMPTIWRDCMSFVRQYQHLASSTQANAAESLHQRWRAQSQRFVVAGLHLASMHCMLKQVAAVNLPNHKEN